MLQEITDDDMRVMRLELEKCPENPNMDTKILLVEKDVFLIDALRKKQRHAQACHYFNNGEFAAAKDWFEMAGVMF